VRDVDFLAVGCGSLLAAVITGSVMAWALSPVRLKKVQDELDTQALEMDLQEANFRKMIRRADHWGVDDAYRGLRFQPQFLPTCKRPHFSVWNCYKKHHPSTAMPVMPCMKQHYPPAVKPCKLQHHRCLREHAKKQRYLKKCFRLHVAGYGPKTQVVVVYSKVVDNTANWLYSTKKFPSKSIHKFSPDECRYCRFIHHYPEHKRKQK